MAERANLGKSRFLAAASHDLRQPLQTISLLQGILAKRVKDEGTLKLVAQARRDRERHVEHARQAARHQPARSRDRAPGDRRFPDQCACSTQLRTEFTYHAAEKGLGWRVVPSSLTVTQRSAPARADASAICSRTR